MKAEFDKEIDSLLRSRGRGGRAASFERDGRVGRRVPPPFEHLDADEQSAYAENVLPAAARAHYTAHLADCDDCRHGVTQLALAAGMPAQLESRETATGQTVSQRVTWRERFGALFAPRAWRYAVPALALLLVSAVSLVVLMRRTPQEASTSVAERNASGEQRPQATAQNTAPSEMHHAPQNGNSANTSSATSGGESATAAPDANASPAREEIAANRPRAEAVQPLVGASDEPPPPAPSSGAGAGAPTVSGLPTPAPTPEPVADAVTVTSAQEAKTKSTQSAPELARNERRQGGFEDREYQNRRDQLSGPRRNEQARNTRDADASRNRAADKKDENLGATSVAAPATAAAPARRAPRREADRSGDDRPAEASRRSEGTPSGAAAETRTVAGRKFRRQGDAWVDAAYGAGQSYTVVRRNSEQFRALVADEPGLRRIADALGGEVTVVWKGRAYRIR